MPTTMTKELQFDYGHRVLGHEGKCKHLHGHRGRVEITVGCDTLDGIGRVIDFGVVKEKVGKWIDDNLDHNMILNPNDPLAKKWIAFGMGPSQDVEKSAELFGKKEPFIMPNNQNPTAENLASLIFVIANTILSDKYIRVIHVRFFETPTSSADYWEETPQEKLDKMMQDAKARFCGVPK